MRRSDRDGLLLLLLLALGSRRSSSTAPRGKIPEGPPTEDNWIPSQPQIPPNPLEHK